MKPWMDGIYASGRLAWPSEVEDYRLLLLE